MDREEMEDWADLVLVEIEKTGLFKYNGNSKECASAWDQAGEIIVRHTIKILQIIIQELES